MSHSSENNKRIAKNTLLLYIRMLFIMAVQLYTSRIILNTLGVSDYGIYNVVGGVVTMLGFLNGTMSAATQRFITFELGCGNYSRLQTVFSTTLQIHTLISAIVVLFAETIGLWFLNYKMQIPVDRQEAAFWVYQCSILASVITIMSVPYNSAIIAHEKMSAFAYISILEVILKLIIVYLLALSPIDKLILYATLILLVQLLIRLCYSYYCNKHFPESKYKHHFNKQLFREMTSFAGWNLVPNIVSVLNTQGINILLNLFFGPTVNAARGIAVQVQNAMYQFSANFQMAINPQIVKSYAAGEYERTQQLMYRSARFSFYLLFMIALPVMLETNFILTLWLKIVPEHTVVFLQIMMGCILLYTFSSPMCEVAYATGNIKRLNITCSIIVLLALPVSWVALKLGAPAYWAFLFILIFEIISQIARMYILRTLTQFSIRDFAKKVYFPAFLVACISTILPYTLCQLTEASFIRMLLTIILSIASVGIFGYTLGITKEERIFIKNKVQARIKFHKI